MSDIDYERIDWTLIRTAENLVERHRADPRKVFEHEIERWEGHLNLIRRYTQDNEVKAAADRVLDYLTKVGR